MTEFQGPPRDESAKRTYYTTDFVGRWAVPTAAVAIAGSLEEATRMLRKALAGAGLPKPDDDFVVVELTEGVCILSDGEY